MQDFIVLGLIPGTNIQIGFFGILSIIAVLLVLHIITRRTRQASAVRYLELRLSLLLVNHRAKKA